MKYLGIFFLFMKGKYIRKTSDVSHLHIGSGSQKEMGAYLDIGWENCILRGVLSFLGGSVDLENSCGRSVFLYITYGGWT